MLQLIFFKKKTENICSLLFILLVALTVSAQAQDLKNGYIITLQKDTIAGTFIDYKAKLSLSSCQFQPQNSKQTKTYQGDELVEISVGGTTYSSQIISGSFVRCIIDDYLSLYQMEENLFYLRTSEGKVFELSTNKADVILLNKSNRKFHKKDDKWKGILKYVTFEYFDYLPNQRSLYLARPDLKKYVGQYNDFKTGRISVNDFLERHPYRTIHNYGVSFGYQLKTFEGKEKNNFPEIGLYDFNPVIGFFYNFQFPNILRDIYGQVEVQWTPFNTKTFESLEESYYQINWKLSTLQIPISIKKVWDINRIPIGLQLGAQLNYNVSQEGTLFSERLRNSIVKSKQTDFMPITERYWNYWGGIEIQKSFRKFKLGLDLRYHFSPDIKKSNEFIFTSNAYSISILLIR